MKVIECEQGTPEWHQARTAVITASMFKTCRDRYKSGKNEGQFKAAAQQYAFKLAIERLSGELLSEDKFDTFEMRRGRELEPHARLLHEEREEIFIEQAGFVLTDDGRFGASVDGLFLDNDGVDCMSEYKCFIAPKSLMPIILDDDISEQLDQIQGGDVGW